MKKGYIVKFRNYTPIRRTSTVITLFFGFAFLFLAILNNFMLCGFLSFVLFPVYLIVYSLQHKRLLMKYMFLLFGIVFYFIGNAICVFFKVYLVELGVTTHYNGSLSVLVFYYWIYLSLLSFFDFKLSPLCYKKTVHIDYKISNIFSLNTIIIKYGRALVFIISLVMLIFVFRSPAFLSDVNRFEYAKKYLPVFLYKIRTVPILLSPIIIVSILKDKKSKNIKRKIFSIFVTYFPYILFSLWIGNKFGIFWQLFYSIALPLTIYINFEKVNGMSLFKYIISGILVLFLIVLVFYIVRGHGFNAILEKLFRRFSAQGEIWWTVFSDKKVSGISGLIDEIDDIITSITTRGDIKQYGVYKIMKLYGEPSYIRHYFDIDMRFSAMGFELSYCFLGVLSFLIFPLVTIPIYVFIVNFYINSVSNEDFIKAFALFRILTVYDAGTCQGDWYRFTSFLDLLVISLLLFSILVKERNRYFGVEKKYN